MIVFPRFPQSSRSAPEIGTQRATMPSQTTIAITVLVTFLSTMLAILLVYMCLRKRQKPPVSIEEEPQAVYIGPFDPEAATLHQFFWLQEHIIDETRKEPTLREILKKEQELADQREPIRGDSKSSTLRKKLTKLAKASSHTPNAFKPPKLEVWRELPSTVAIPEYVPEPHQVPDQLPQTGSNQGQVSGEDLPLEKDEAAQEFRQSKRSMLKDLTAPSCKYQASN